MDKETTQKFKQKLEEEKGQLEKDLASIGRRNPENSEDWEATPEKSDYIQLADLNEEADQIEEYEGNTAILKQLEIRYNEVRCALERIDEGTYGICEVSGKPIEEERLEANPAARTSIEHMNEK